MPPASQLSSQPEARKSRAQRPSRSTSFCFRWSPRSVVTPSARHARSWGAASVSRWKPFAHSGLEGFLALSPPSDEDEQILGGYNKGADCYLTKPLQPRALLNIVDYLIGDLPADERAKLEQIL